MQRAYNIKKKQKNMIVIQITKIFFIIVILVYKYNKNRSVQLKTL